MITIYHNPRCSKSRQTLKILEEKSSDIQVIEYLKEPPSEDQLKSILGKLGMKPQELVRKGEAIFKEKFKGKNMTDEEWVKSLVSYPKLIERPIVVKGNNAVIGRPPEKVEEIL